MRNKNDDSVREWELFNKKTTISCRSGDIFVTKSDPGKKNPKIFKEQKRQFRARVVTFGQKNDDFVQERAHFRGGGKNDDSVCEWEQFATKMTIL